MTQPLIEAIYNDQLAGVDPTTAAEHEAIAVGDRITAEVEASVEQLLGQLEAAGHHISAQPGRSRQRHEAIITVADGTVAERVGETLAGLGLDEWRPLDGAARQSRLHHHTELVFARTDAVTFVVRLRWREESQPTLLQRIFRPSPADWAFVDLPPWAWRLYPAVRPVRLGLERSGLMDRAGQEVAPFLATPESLIGPLLDFAGLTADDSLLDIGCGDGRIAIEAARRTGCSAVGVERSPHLVAEARERARAAGVSEQVRIDMGDLQATSLDGATVVFTFLPYDVVGPLLPRLLGELAPGGRVVAHEQSRLSSDLRPQPTRTVPLIGENALTVAHRWDKTD